MSAEETRRDTIAMIMAAVQDMLELEGYDTNVEPRHFAGLVAFEANGWPLKIEVSGYRSWANFPSYCIYKHPLDAECSCDTAQFTETS